MQSLHFQALLNNARTLTHLSDFGDEDFLPGMEILVNDINQHGNISPSRVDALKQRFFRLLSDRLYFAEDLTRHPEILDEKIVAPVEISSLPRTGSTKLHRLLAASGQFQFLPMWKTHRFARLPGKEQGGEAARRAEIKALEDWILSVSPDFNSGHPMFTDEAEEDQWLGECTFRRPMTAMMFDAPNYALWLSRQDPSISQRYFKQQLQYLQWQNRRYRGDAEAAKPWLLKSPDNFGCEPILASLFPDMRFVITHRSPLECIPSCSTMSIHFRRLYAEDYQPEALLAPLVHMISAMANAHVSWRDSNRRQPVLDVPFVDITERGLSAAKAVFDFLSLPWTEAAQAGMEKWEENNAQHKHGKNRYSMADLGVTEEQLNIAFATYMARYGEFI